MVQPKYSPTEALNKMKLMMSYDSSKTLNENEQSLKPINENTQLLNEIIPLVAGLALAGNFNVPGWANASTIKKIKALSEGCDKTDAKSVALKRETLTNVEQAKLASQFKKSFDWTVGGFGIGGGTDLEILRAALGVLESKGNYGDYCKVRELMDGKQFESDMIEELNNEELGEVVSVIQLLLTKSAKGNIKTRDAETANVNWWIEAYPCLEVTDSFADPITVTTDRYGNSYVSVNFKIKGQVKEFHLLNNGRIYTADTHKYTGKKVECTGTKVSVIAESLKKKSIYEQADLGNIDLSGNGVADLDPEKEKEKKKKKLPVTNRYRNCTGTYTKGCKTDPTGPIGVVQGCLGLTVDGRFWDKTQTALIAKRYTNGFTDADIPKICEKTNDQEISGESPSEIDPSNTDF
jgi:hypothetical protein